MTAAPPLQEAFDALITAEREAQRWHDHLTDCAEDRHDELMAEIRRRLEAAKGTADATLQWSALARLLGELEGADVADALIDVLATESPEARQVAGDQLEALAFSRFKEVALAVERALERLPDGSPALVELPFILAEIGEGGVTRLLAMFLQKEDPDVVAAGIEAMVELGDPACVRHLEPLVEDDRATTLDEDRASLSELAADALALFEQLGGLS